MPLWAKNEGGTKQLAEIRRAYHTLKGSGRMAGALALSEYAWAHERLLNKVLAGDLSPDNDVTQLIQRSVRYLDTRQSFLLSASELDEVTQAEINGTEAFWDSKKTSIYPPADHRTSADGEAKRLLKDKASEDKHEQASGSPPLASVDETEENRIIWEMFREELPEQLHTIDQLMLALYTNPENVEVRHSLERELHTLKGSARMARLTEMGDIAHKAEELLVQANRVQQKSIEPELGPLQAYIDTVGDMAEQHSLPGIPTMDVSISDFASKPEESPTETVHAEPLISFSSTAIASAEGNYGSYLEQLLVDQADTLPDISVLRGLREQNESDREVRDTKQVDTTFPGQEQVRLSAIWLDKLVEGANSLNIQQNTLGERLQSMSEDVGEFGRTVSRLKQLLRSLELETEAQIHAGYRQSMESQGQSSNFDPLEMDEYSEIQRLSRALAESLNDLVNIEGDLVSQLRSAGRYVKEGQHSSRELHQDLLSTRLVAVSVVMPRLRRILRQTAAELGRQVNLDVEGESLKLDRHLLQRMTAPVEHILRNAISHGIEPPDEREKLGKSATGQIIIKVTREDDEMVLSVQDDGRGLDLKTIYNKALEQGLIKEKDDLSEQEIQRLILRPGFSTAQQVSQIAGRGVGMDVVSSGVKALGGNLLIDSVPGRCTIFTLRLPFGMAANPVLFVSVQDYQYALPIGNIQGLTRMKADTIQQYLGQDETLEFNDETYPLHYLGPVLGHENPLKLVDDAMYPVVYTRAGGHCVAWVVDVINGRRDVVLQSLGALFKSCRYYSAATITAEGYVVMVPDMMDMSERVLSAPETDKPDMALQKPEETQAVRHERPHIMIIDDSITVRKVTEKLLQHENYVVETARDGLEALEKLDSFEPDLALLDIEMPRMDGFEVLGAIRANPRWKHLPIIMISSRTAEKHRQHAEQLGASGFLGKPYQNQTLLEHIDHYLTQASVEEVFVI